METENKPVGRFDKSKGNVIDKKHIEKVINGTAKVRKKSEVAKLKDAFISEDAANVKTYILTDVLIPEIKRLLVNIIKDSADMFFNGHVRRDGKRDRYNGDYVSYDRFSSSRGDDRRRYESSRPSRFNYDDIVFNTRGDAEAVLDAMASDIRKYGFVTVSDLYDMVEQTAPFTGNNYGWTDIRSATVERVYDGYILKLPRAIAIER